MNFKSVIGEDVRRTFINADEFAQMHSINGKNVECIIDTVENDKSLKYLEGTTTVERAVYLKAEDIDVMPQANGYINIDNELVEVYSVEHLEGLIQLQLKRAIGKFDKVIEIQQAYPIKVNGFVKEEWKQLLSCKAYIRTIRAEEKMKVGTSINNKIMLVKIPYTNGLTEKMRLIYKNEAYNITSIDNIEEENIFIDITCEVSR